MRSILPVVSNPIPKWVTNEDFNLHKYVYLTPGNPGVAVYFIPPIFYPAG